MKRDSSNWMIMRRTELAAWLTALLVVFLFVPGSLLWYLTHSLSGHLECSNSDRAENAITQACGHSFSHSPECAGSTVQVKPSRSIRVEPNACAPVPFAPHMAPVLWIYQFIAFRSDGVPAVPLERVYLLKKCFRC